MKKKFYMDTEFHEYQKDTTLLKDAINSSSVHQTLIDTIELISIGIIDEDGNEYYAISNEFDIDDAWNNEWLRDNVLKNLFDSKISGNKTSRESMTIKNFKSYILCCGKSKYQIREEIKSFCVNGDYTDVKKRMDEGLETIEPIPVNDYEFYAYYGDYDWVVFCWLFGRMIDLPKGFPMYCKDLKQLLDGKAELLKKKISNRFSKGLDFDEVLFIKSLHNYPTQDNLHNALDDAKWNKKLHEFLNELQ